MDIKNLPQHLQDLIDQDIVEPMDYSPQKLDNKKLCAWMKKQGLQLVSPHPSCPHRISFMVVRSLSGAICEQVVMVSQDEFYLNGMYPKRTTKDLDELWKWIQMRKDKYQGWEKVSLEPLLYDRDRS